jgi:hypothetical protein
VFPLYCKRSATRFVIWGFGVRLLSGAPFPSVKTWRCTRCGRRRGVFFAGPRYGPELSPCRMDRRVSNRVPPAHAGVLDNVQARRDVAELSRGGAEASEAAFTL